jgi:glyoxylate reductase
MKPKLLLTRYIPEAAIDRLHEYFDLVVYPPETAMTHTEICTLIKDAEALICLLTDTIDKAVIDSAPRLKVISAYAVGYNNIDVEYATSKGIAVCNTAGVLTESTADLTWALIMATCRRITESEAYLRAGKFKAWEPMLMLGQDVYGKTLGILGMGRIGQAVAKRALGFDMRIIYHSTTPKALHFQAQQVDMDTLLKESDILTLHTPLTPITQHLIGKAEIDQMKRNAVLINTARGAIVDEKALITALKEGRIFGAGFDVYEHEPHIPPALLALRNVVLLPHIGSASIATRTNMGIMAAENAIAIMEARPALSQVNKLK